MRIADPRPSLCTACGNSGDHTTRFVDAESVREGPVVLDPQTRTIALDPDGSQVTFDDVYICDACVREMGDLVGFKPELHSRQFQAIRQAELERDHWKATTKRLQAELEKQIEANRTLGAGATVRRRKAVA